MFHGTRTVLQLLDDDGRATRGSATDVPAYRERGVGVCACYINVSVPWFERLMKDMASQKLNQLWIEAKVRSDVDPESAFWATTPRTRPAPWMAMATATADAGVGSAWGSSAAWTLTATADDYYTVRSAGNGLCLDATRGKKYLGAPLEVGAELSLGACSATARTQRRQLDSTAGSLVLRNAVSQLRLTERAYDGAAVRTVRGTSLRARTA